MSTKNLRREERNEIIILHRQGLNISQIAEELHMSRNTVRLWIRRHEEEGVLEDRPRAPRPFLISEENVQRMVNTYKQGDAFTSKEFAEEYDVSRHTVRRALNRALYRRKTAKKKVLTRQQKAARNEESTSENDTIHVFCPKCKTKVPHTAAGIQQDQTKILIAKVYHYFEQEYEELKKMYGNLDLSPLSKIRQRTTLATGVSDSMLEEILEEERQREAELARRPRPHKRRRNEDSSSDENTSDDSDGDAEVDTDVQQPEQPYAATETLVVKIEQPEVNIDEPEIFVPAPLKTEPSDYGANNEQVQMDPISLYIKTEPQDDEITIETQELNKPGTSKHKERKRTRKSQNTSTQQRTQGESSTASTSRNILMEALEQSRLLDETEFKTEEIDVHEEGFS